MKKKILQFTIILFIFLNFSVQAQYATSVEWIRTFGGDKDDEARSVIETPDNNYLVAGFTQSFGMGKQDAWIIKIDQNGNKIWEKTYGGSDDDAALKIINTSDNNFIFCGRTKSFGNGNEKCDFWVVKIDQLGEVIWNKTFGADSCEHSMDIIETQDNGFIIVGGTESKGNGKSDFWIIKIDKDGSLLWDISHGMEYYERANAIVARNQNEYIIVGQSDAYLHNEAGKNLIIINDNGQIIEEKSLIISDEWQGAGCQDIIRKNDNSFLIVGHLWEKAGNSTLIEIDNNGNQLFGELFCLNQGIYSGSYSITDYDNNFIIAGGGFAPDWNNFTICKIDNDNNQVWSLDICKKTPVHTCGFDGFSLQVIKTSKNNLLAVGRFAQDGDFDYDSLQYDLGIVKFKERNIQPITEYVNTQIETWKLKGYYEKTIDWQQRINDSLDIQTSIYTTKAVNKYIFNIRETGLLNDNLLSAYYFKHSKYNPDTETWTLYYYPFSPIEFKNIPSNEAKSLDESLNSSGALRFTDIQYTIRDNIIYIKHMKMTDYYNYENDWDNDHFRIFIYDE